MMIPHTHRWAALALVLLTAGAASAEPPQLYTVEEAVVRALSVHPELRAAVLRRDAAEHDARAAHTQLLPTASANGSYTHTGKLPTTTIGAMRITTGAEDAVSVTGRVDQPVFTGGRLSAQIGQADAARTGEDFRLESTRQALILRTREACYEVIRASALYLSANEATASARAHRKDAEARVRAGVAAGVEITRADVRVSEAALNEISLRNRRDLATARLASTLGLPTAADIGVSGELPAAQAPPFLPDDEALAVATRADLKAARTGVRISELSIQSARAGYFPSVAAFGSWTWQDDETRKGDETWNLGLTGTWQIFDWGRTSHQVGAAQARTGAGDADAKAMEDRIRVEVRETRLAIGTAVESIRLAESRITAAAEDLRISRLRFNEGVGTGTEVIDAEKNLQDARSALINARADLAVASARYTYATGGAST